MKEFVRRQWLKALLFILRRGIVQRTVDWMCIEIVVFVRGHELYHKVVTDEDVNSIVNFLDDNVLRDRTRKGNGE